MQFIAASVSAEARHRLTQLSAALGGIVAQRRPPQTLEEFEAAAQREEILGVQLGGAALQALAPQVSARQFGGVAALEVLPAEGVKALAPVVFIHGGGFVSGSAKSSLLVAAFAAVTSGRRIISLDYGLAPRHKWRGILDQIANAWHALREETGNTPIGLMGESAGGCIAAATCLNLREKGIAGPAAIALLSPVTDLSRSGDTDQTLAAVDYLDTAHMQAMGLAYADESEHCLPLVSPLFGDFSAGFPPALILAGTRERLLSDSVRLHRRLRAAQQPSRLELFEGMPHGYHGLLGDTPEGQATWSEIAAHWEAHLSC